MKKLFLFLFGDRTSWGFIPESWRSIKAAWNNAKYSVKDIK